jgi:hypothetical protein
LLSPLALKAAIFSIILSMVNSHWSLVVVFILVSFYLYFRPSLNSSQFILSFLVLLATSLLIVLLVNGQWSLVISLFFGFLFFLLLGVKNLIFVNRQPFYYLFNGLLLLVIFISFFWAENSRLFFIKYLSVFFAIAFLFREFLIFSINGFSNSTKKNLIVYGAAFLIFQLLWAITLLPISFLNAAGLALLIVMILQDFIVHHFSGTMSRQIVLRNVTVFLILSLVIFGASKWQP